MKVLLVSTTERAGGGAIAARRLLIALNNNGVSAKMIVRDRQTDLPYVLEVKKTRWSILKFVWERFVIWANNLFSRENLFKVSIANTGFDITKLKEFQEADIIHLHWINQGMLSLNNLQQIIKSGKPIVWTMHDMWECTAICHYAYTCNNFKYECKHCPFLRFPFAKDLSNRVFRKKKQIFNNAFINIVTVSKWLEKQVKDSTLLKHCPTNVIPNTLSLSDFTPHDKNACRKALGLPTNARIILFGAARIDDPIKGFSMLISALEYLIKTKGVKAEDLHLLTFGIYKQCKPNIPIACTDMGWIKNNTLLSQLYSAADIVVSASLYETFGQTLIEAQACGCLPISFGNSGQSDIISHKKNGYLAEYLSVESIAEGIKWGLNEGQNIDMKAIREEVLHKYSEDVVATQYLSLYKNIVTNKGK